MRKLFVLATLLITGLSFAQIKVLPTTHLERLGRIGTNNDVYVQKEANEFTFFFKDIESPNGSDIKNFTFKNVDNDYENFYKIIMDGFYANPINDIKLELPKEYIWLRYTKGINKLVVQFMTIDKASSSIGISQMMNPDDIKKLFEKI